MHKTYKIQILTWLICAFVFTTSVLAQSASATLHTRLSRLMNQEFFQRATAGVAVYDLTAQKMLYTHNEKRLCRPASNMKLLTSAAALSALTSDYSFKTGLFYTGVISEKGQLLGDIYLVGGFDPELKFADMDTLISWVKKAGIHSMDGRLYLDASMADTVFWGKAWSWDDDLETFQPYLSPIPLNKGVAKLKVIPAMPGRAPIIQTEPESSFIQIVNRATTTMNSAEPAGNTLRIGRESNGTNNRIVVSGSISASANAYETKISLKNPRVYALTIFHEKLIKQFPESNIVASGTMRVPATAQNLGYVTHSIAEVLKRLNKESDNLNAEMLLYALGYRKNNGPSSIGKGIAGVQQLMTKLGFDPDSYRMVDGSGLSNQNCLTPEQLVAVLKYLYQSPDFDLFHRTLPVAGVDGTLANRMKNSDAYRKVSAKTGSLTGVNALSGYVMASNGHLLAFSILIQNFTEKTSYVSVNYIDKICEALTE